MLDAPSCWAALLDTTSSVVTTAPSSGLLVKVAKQGWAADGFSFNTARKHKKFAFVFKWFWSIINLYVA